MILNKRDSGYIKGIAIIMMIFHHFFAFPEWQLTTGLFMGGGSVLGKPLEVFLGEICKLCVCIFAFISGYGTYVSLVRVDNHGCIKYALRKIANLLLMYWLSLLFVVSVLSIFKKISTLEIICNIILQSTSIIYTAWYVVFYIQAIVMALICFRINKLLAECIFLLPIPVLIEYVDPGNMFSHYFPVFMLGYIFSKYRLYEKWENLYKRNFLKYVTSTFLLLMAFILRLVVGDSIGPVSVITLIGPIITYALVYFVRICTKIKLIDKILTFCSKYSVWYWFVHVIFHSKVVWLQNIGYLPKIPLLIIIWVFIILTPVAILLQKVYLSISSILRMK